MFYSVDGDYLNNIEDSSKKSEPEKKVKKKLTNSKNTSKKSNESTNPIYIQDIFLLTYQHIFLLQRMYNWHNIKLKVQDYHYTHYS